MENYQPRPKPTYTISAVNAYGSSEANLTTYTSTMNPIHKFWRWFTTPHTIAEWKWEGNDLSDLPRAAWRDFLRAIRGPILKVLIGDDLVIVGDIYCSRENQSSPLIQVPRDKHAEIIGNITVYDGPTTLVPKGCNPKVCDQPDNLNV